MPQPLSHAEILEKLSACLVPALGITAKEVTPDASLVDDLGAESIDMVDIVFRIRKEFGLHLDFADLQSALYGGLSEAEFFDSNRSVTPAGLTRLQTLLPDFDPAAYHSGLSERHLYSLFRVRHLVELIATRLEKMND